MAKRHQRLTGVVTAGALALLGTRLVLGRIRAMSFRGAVVLVTGGSRGLGLLLAREFGRRGAHVAICARDADELERARLDLEQRGVACLPLRGDVADMTRVDAMIGEIRDRWGPIDVVVNNAGVMAVGPLETMTLGDYRAAMDVNFWGALHTVFAVLPAMRQRGAGRIVNIASIGGKISVPHLSPYCASKFALTGLSEALRAELARDGILVTTVCPGLMRTGSPRNADFKGQHQAEYAWFSISDALPLVSMDAERAAAQIVRACARGEPEVILSLPARIAARVQGLAPGLVSELLSVVNRLLPSGGGIGRASLKGHESESALSPSWLTRMGDRAAARHNEIGAAERAG